MCQILYATCANFWPRVENNITATTYEEQQRLNKKRPSEAVTLANTRIEDLLSDSEDDIA